MSRGKINLQANDGAVIGLVVPDGLASGERQISLGSNLSNFASYHLIDGNLSVDSFVNTQGMNTTLYTGNGTTQSINTGIDMSTQWGNDASETFGGLVWCKSRSSILHNVLANTITGGSSQLWSDSTGATDTGADITGFTSSGFTVGNRGQVNPASATLASWNFQTTHRITGTTNHGKAYTCHYNPFTGFTMVKYEGSGLAGHEIPHHLGRKLGFWQIKNLSATTGWIGSRDGALSTYLSISATQADSSGVSWSNTENSIIPEVSGSSNVSGNSYILYGWSNSYFDESNKLIGNYEVGVYQGTGVAGNKVKTRGKPAWVMIKRLDSTGDWWIQDNKRIGGRLLYANLSNTEEVNASYEFRLLSDGFIINTTLASANASGGQYLYMVVFDTNSNGGGSFYPKATDNANVQVNNALIPLAKGFDSNGVKNEIVIANETITGVTWEEGKNYPYRTTTGYGKSMHKPRKLKSELIRTYAGEQPDYFDVEKNKWFSCDAGAELVSNGDFSSGTTTGWTATLGTTISVVNSTLRISTPRANVGNVYSQIPFIAGKKYIFKLTASQLNSNMYLFAWITNQSGVEVYRIFSNVSNVDNSYELVAQPDWYNIVLYLGGGASGDGLYSVDNISVFPIEITPTTEIPESRNYMNHIVHADSQGNPLFVEELPKVKYENYLKVDGFDLGQDYVDYSGLKFGGIPYKNDTKKPITVMVRVYCANALDSFYFIVNGKSLPLIGNGGSAPATYQYFTQAVQVPPDGTYKLVLNDGAILSPSSVNWVEYE